MLGSIYLSKLASIIIKDKLMVAGWAYILLGAILIGVGGVFGTLGWNKIQTASEKREILAAVKRECESNLITINQAVEIASSDGSNGWNFPSSSYKSSRLSFALSSGKLVFDSQKRKELYNAMKKCEESIANFNASLRIVGRFNAGLFIKTNLIHDPNLVNSTPLKERLADGFKNLSSSHEQLISLLRN